MTTGAKPINSGPEERGERVRNPDWPGPGQYPQEKDELEMNKAQPGWSFGK